jgi:hypothetical protein
MTFGELPARENEDTHGVSTVDSKAFFLHFIKKRVEIKVFMGGRDD